MDGGLCAKDDANDDFAEQLWHEGTIGEEGFWMNRAFSAGLCACSLPGALPQAYLKCRAVGAKQIAGGILES
jgi:hypothetical protein